MNVILKKYRALQTEFFATVHGKEIPGEGGARYPLTFNSCIECNPEKGWLKKFGEILGRHSIGLDIFAIAAKKKAIGFSVKEGELHLEHDRCPQFGEVFDVIAELMPEEEPAIPMPEYPRASRYFASLTPIQRAMLITANFLPPATVGGIPDEQETKRAIDNVEGASLTGDLRKLSIRMTQQMEEFLGSVADPDFARTLRYFYGLYL